MHLNLAVDTILHAKHIYIIGIRSCAPLASFMGFLFYPDVSERSSDSDKQFERDF